MAAAAKRSGNSRIFWMNGVSEWEKPLAFVPGVDGGPQSAPPLCLGTNGIFASAKRGTKMEMKHVSNGKKQASQKATQRQQGHFQSDYPGSDTTKEASVPERDPVPAMQNLSQPSDTFLPLPQVSSKAKNDISLKDLCFEDKKRIAHLIEELARVSEEKEESMQRLKDEQGNFERKIQVLEQQNLMIAQERESLQQQYKECQELLALYQQYLSQQQAKLNQSIAQLSQATHNKVLASEETQSRSSASRANGSLFDGSYLGLTAAGVQQSQVFRGGSGRRGAAETFRNHESLSCDSVLSPHVRATKQHMSQKKDCRKPRICYTCERCQGSCHDSSYDAQHWRSESCSCLVNCHHDSLNRREHQRFQSGNMINAEAKEALTRPLLGHEDWEEKRHQLLLQKMQLEMEREKLQARLAEQEERLGRQTEQLRQSRLHHSSQAQFSSSKSQNEGSEPKGPSHQDLPSRSSEDGEVDSAAEQLHGKTSEAIPASSLNAKKQSKSDMATSPLKNPSAQSVPTSVSATQNTSESRLDDSLAEVLDIFSPFSAQKQHKPAAGRPKTSQHSSALAGFKSGKINLLTPGGNHRQNLQQDLEESQILEDIFFIC
ncbi:PREDICTED: protein hinderin [Cyprinodon variegatus]|uniref:protein hinderin n=1 Tax=Cyprinodon variegatus TaxID=28743 RepID=UPI00074291BF|nr:PREDICTED: protein hinderin [Cyprinodon variegatus]